MPKDDFWEIEKNGKVFVLTEVSQGKYRWLEKGKGIETKVSVNGVIIDSLGADLEHQGFSDGRRTDSKSVFRKWTKECGGVEMGNDREKVVKRKLTSKDLTQDVARSIDMLRQGYKPSILNSREWE